MFKRVIISVFVAMISLSPLTVLAANVEANIQAKSLLATVNQANFKQPLLEISQIDSNSSDIKTKNSIIKSEPNQNEQTGWLLALALFGFVMLSNRRNI